MTSNYPPGVSDSTFGSPWNEQEFEFTLEVTFGGTIQGPTSLDDFNEQVAQIMKDTMKNINDKIDNVENIEEI